MLKGPKLMRVGAGIINLDLASYSNCQVLWGLLIVPRLKIVPTTKLVFTEFFLWVRPWNSSQSLWNFINSSRVLQVSLWYYKLVVFSSDFLSTWCKLCNITYCTVKFTFVFLCLGCIPMPPSHHLTQTLKEKGRKRGVKDREGRREGGRIDERTPWSNKTDMWVVVMPLVFFTNSSNQYWVGFLLKGRGIF